MNAASSTALSPASSTSALNTQNGVPAFGLVSSGSTSGSVVVVAAVVPVWPATVVAVAPPGTLVPPVVPPPVESPGVVLPVDVPPGPAVVATTVVSWPIGIG